MEGLAANQALLDLAFIEMFMEEHPKLNGSESLFRTIDGFSRVTRSQYWAIEGPAANQALLDLAFIEMFMEEHF